MAIQNPEEQQERLKKIRAFYGLLIDMLWEIEHLDDITVVSRDTVNQEQLDSSRFPKGDPQFDLRPWNEILGDQTGNSVTGRLRIACIGGHAR